MAKRMTPGSARVFGIGFATFAGLFIVIGGTLARSQETRLRDWRPVEALVTGSEIRAHRGSKSTTYAPVVRFTYRVDGIEHTAGKTSPLDVSSSESWARALVARFPTGQHTTAYYDPGAPGEAYLVHEADIFPYLFILFPMLHACIGLAVWWFGGSPGLDAAGKARRMGWLAAIWLGVGILALTHYLSVGGASDLGAGVVFGIYGALGAGLVAAWSRFARRIAAGDVAVPPSPSAPDMPDAPRRH
jgi:hypothetical protein